MSVCPVMYVVDVHPVPTFFHGSSPFRRLSSLVKRDRVGLEAES